MKITEFNIIAALQKHQPKVVFPKWVTWTAVTLLLAYLLYAPLVTMPFANTERTLICAYAIVGLGLNLLTGLTGQISLGHGAFFALGAYLSGILIGVNGWPYLVALPIAAVAGFAAGWLFGRPTLRLRGLSLALVTLALALVTPAIIRRLEPLTQGREGIILDIAQPPAATGLARDQWVYYLALAILVVLFTASERLSRGRIGRSLIGIRDNEDVAVTLGIRPSVLKTNIFAFGTAMAAVGGVVYTYAIQFVGPDAFGLDLAIVFITVIVIGGLGSNVGAVLGAAFVVFIPSWTQDIGQEISGLTYGVTLVVFMFFLPFGLIGLFRAVVLPIARRPGAKEELVVG